MRIRRIAAVAIWTGIACFGWMFALDLTLNRLVRVQLGHILASVLRRRPDWTDDLVMYGLFGVGTLLITATALIFGLRGKLPFTSTRSRLERGFPVETDGR